MNPGAPVFIPGGGGGHPVPPWPSPPSASVPPFPIPPSFSASIPTPLSSTNDSLHSFVTAIIFAYQQGVIAGSAISCPPSFLPTSIAPSTQPSARDSASTSSIPSIPYPTISVPPPSTIGMTISPSAHRISSPQIDHPSVRRIPGPVTPSLTTNKNTIAISTPHHSLHSAPAPKRSSTIPSPLDYSIIINKLPIGLSGFPLIKPSRSSSLLPSTPFRALPPFTIRKDRRRNKRNGWRSSKRSSTIKSKPNNPRGEKKNNIPSPSSINHIPNRFSILASLDTVTPRDIDHDHPTITISSPRAPTRSSTQLIDDSSTSSTSRPSDLAHPSVDVVIADSIESNDTLIEAEIEEIVKPLINGVCMNAVMNAEFIDLTGGDLYEWAECDAFINHPSRLPSPPPPDSPPSSYNTPLICHICSSEVFSCCPECLAPLCYPHFNPTDDQFASTNSTLPAHNCAAFILSVADDADRRQKEKNDDTNAVQKTQAATKNAKKKTKKERKKSTVTNPLPSSTPAPIPSVPAPPSLPSSIITRRILDDLIERFNSCHNRIKPKKLKGELNRTIEKLTKSIDDHYDKLLYADDDDIDNDKYDELAYNRNIPITLSSKLADALHSLQSHLASL